MKNSTEDRRGTATTDTPAITWAREHFERTGYDILATGAETRWGTLDLVAHDGRTIVFVDVSSAVSQRSGAPAVPVVHDRKRRQVRRLAAAWLSETTNRPTGRDVRFDTVRVLADAEGRMVRLDHIEAAL